MANGETRDPGTGKLTPWGYTERVFKLAQWLVIPILIWAVGVQIFISKGPRFTEADARNLSLTLSKEWRAELQSAIKDGQLPVAALRLTNLELDVKEVRQEVAKVRDTVQANERRLTAIQLLLEDDRR